MKLEVPLSHRLSLVADGSVFLRRSHYDFAGSDLPLLVGGPGRRTLTQCNPEVRLFLTWQYNHQAEPGGGSLVGSRRARRPRG